MIFLFTHALLRFVQAACVDLGIPEQNVTSFYSWVWQTHKELIGYPSGDEYNKFDQWVDNLIHYYKLHPDDIPRLDYVLVDEAQDFNPNVSQLLHILTNNLLIAGDSAQSIYKEVGGPKEFLRLWQPISQDYELVNNYRNPKTIARVAALFLNKNSGEREEFLRRVKGKDFEMKPIFYKTHSYKEQIDIIIDLISQSRGSERIGIFFRKGDYIDTFKRYLDLAGTPYQIAKGKSGSYDFQKNITTLTTVHSAKGLEFDWVILPDLNKNVWDEKKFDPNERNLFFVALTRAKNRLILFSQEGCTCSFLKEILVTDPNLVQIPMRNSKLQNNIPSNYDDDPF